MSEEFVSVSVKQGILKGRRCNAVGGNIYFSFEGVPYAKPPVGPLRFKAPALPEPWTGARDATEVGSECLHYDAFEKRLVGSEDCLYLNIYTPDIPSASQSAPLRPVMFYIHGGGFNIGSGHIYHPEPFMDSDVVVVNFNYRLGALGFLSLGNLEVPGNAGLKDQTMALRWVKENIAAFGGDPGNVTIFGESAGGASVHYHVLSPLSKGLFHRAIAQSGTALCPWALAKDPASRASRLALASGCPATTAKDPGALAQWLREVPAEKLIFDVGLSVQEEEQPFGMFIPFVPCVEPCHPEAFISLPPSTIIANGDVPNLPLIFGLTRHEGILFLPVCLQQYNKFRAPSGGVELSDEEKEAAVAKEMAGIAADPAHLLSEDLPSELKPVLAQRLKDFFFDGKPPAENMGLVDVFSDVQFGRGVLQAASDHARLGSPVYLYEFAYSGSINFLSSLLHAKVQGVAHADELSYLFNIPNIPRPGKDSPEASVRQRIVRLWANFAKNGNPTPLCDEIITSHWPPFSDSTPNYLQISEELKADSGLFKERMLFWKDLFREVK